MAFKVEIDAQLDCILVTHRGEIDAAESRAAQALVFATIAGSRLMRVLVDVTGVSNDLSTFTLFDLTAELDRPELPRPAAALLVRADQQANARFMQTVAANRGLQLHAFTDRDAAVRSLQRPRMQARADRTGVELPD